MRRLFISAIVVWATSRFVDRGAAVGVGVVEACVKMIVKTSWCVTEAVSCHGISEFVVSLFPAARSLRNSTPSGGDMPLESGVGAWV